MRRSLQLIAYSLQLRFFLLLTIYCLLLTTLLGCQQNQQLYKDSRIMMGTFIKVVSTHKDAGEIVFAEIKRLEDLLSKYKPDSEVSQLNKQGELRVAPETFYIIKKSKEFQRISDGAFDITVAPLLELWGFTDKEYILPKEEEIKSALSLVDSDKIILKEGNNMVKFKVLGIKIDLGAIAKGYAVDCAVKRLKEAGIESCLINAGGDIYGLGDKSGSPWKVALQNPRSKGFADLLELEDKAVATSGDYEQYFFHDQKKYSHILNPQTGYPVDSKVISVTVIASDCLTADFLATTIFILGEEKGRELAKRFPGVKLKIIENNVQDNKEAGARQRYN